VREKSTHLMYSRSIGEDDLELYRIISLKNTHPDQVTVLIISLAKFGKATKVCLYNKHDDRPMKHTCQNKRP
jgi:hypothetical protein